jgi:hypothetical protein
MKEFPHHHRNINLNSTKSSQQIDKPKTETLKKTQTFGRILLSNIQNPKMQIKENKMKQMCTSSIESNHSQDLDFYTSIIMDSQKKPQLL